MRIGIDGSGAFVGDPTGTERYSYELITRLVALPESKKHEWILYTREKFQDTITKTQTDSNVQIVQIPMRFLWTQVGLAWRTWVDNLDVLWVPAHTLPVLRRPGTKTVVTIHGIEYEWLPAYENWLQRWYLPWSTIYAVRSADGVIAVSEFTKKQLVDRLEASADKVSVVYEGVSETKKVKDGQGQSILKKWDLKPGGYILFVGTVQPRKNLVRLIEAFSRLKWDGKLVVSGKLGWSFEAILEAPKKYGVEERVVFTGYTNETERQCLLQYAVVYVQPSITEGFGLPVIEAMKEGVTVVISKGGALPELVPQPRQFGGQAWPGFDPYDTSDMVDKLSLVLQSPELRLELGRRGRSFASRFTWENAASKTYRILTDIN